MSLLADSPQHTYYYNNQGVGGGGVTLQKVLQLKIQHPLPLLGDKGKVGGGGGGIHAHKERSWELNKSENGIIGW